MIVEQLQKTSVSFTSFESELACIFACRIVLHTNYLDLQPEGNSPATVKVPFELAMLLKENKQLLNADACSELPILDIRKPVSKILDLLQEEQALAECIFTGRVEAMGTQLGLTLLEQKVLLFCLLVDTDPYLEGIISRAQRSFTVEKVILLLATVLNESRDDIRKVFKKTSKLRLSQILNINSEHNSILKILDIDLLTMKLLKDLALPETDIIKGYFSEKRSASLSINDYGHLVSSYQIINSTLVSGDTSVRNYLIYGGAGLGKTEYVYALAERLGYELFEISLTNENGGMCGAWERLVNLCTAKYLLADRPKVAILIDEAEDIFSHLSSSKPNSRTRFNKPWFNQFLETAPVPVFWVTNKIYNLDPAFQRRFTYTMEMAELSEKMRKHLIKHKLKGLPVSKKLVKHLTENSSITPAKMDNVRHVIECALHHIDASSVSVKKVLNRLVDQYLKDSFCSIGLSYRSLKGIKNKKKRFYSTEFTNCNYQLSELTGKMKQQGKGRLCLFGAPGTGKTDYAHFLAKKLKKEIVVKGPSDFLDRYVGGTEQNIASAFKEAKEKDAILLIDEVDTLLANREGSSKQWESTQVNEMLTQIQNFEGVLIVTTNRVEALDPAIFRRFHFKVEFNFLTLEQSRKLLEHHVDQLALEAEESSGLLKQLSSCGGLTPGDFSVVRERFEFLECNHVDQFVDELFQETSFRRSQSKSIGFTVDI